MWLLNTHQTLENIQHQPEQIKKRASDPLPKNIWVIQSRSWGQESAIIMSTKESHNDCTGDSSAYCFSSKKDKSRYRKSGVRQYQESTQQTARKGMKKKWDLWEAIRRKPGWFWNHWADTGSRNPSLQFNREKGRKNKIQETQQVSNLYSVWWLSLEHWKQEIVLKRKIFW